MDIAAVLMATSQLSVLVVVTTFQDFVGAPGPRSWRYMRPCPCPCVFTPPLFVPLPLPLPLPFLLMQKAPRVKLRGVFKSLVETMEICHVTGRQVLQEKLLDAFGHFGVEFSSGFVVWLHLRGYRDAGRVIGCRVKKEEKLNMAGFDAGLSLPPAQHNQRTREGVVPLHFSVGVWILEQ